MPLLSELFGKYVKDKKYTQCEFIDSQEELPFIKRCPYLKTYGLRVCRVHAKSVTYKDGRDKLRTAYFNNVAGAEYFKRTIGNRWVECNYGKIN